VFSRSLVCIPARFCGFDIANSIQMGHHVSSMIHGIVDGRTHRNVQVHDVSQCICLITFFHIEQSNKTTSTSHNISKHPSLCSKKYLFFLLFFFSNNILLSTFFSTVNKFKSACSNSLRRGCEYQESNANMRNAQYPFVNAFAELFFRCVNCQIAVYALGPHIRQTCSCVQRRRAGGMYAWRGARSLRFARRSAILALTSSLCCSLGVGGASTGGSCLRGPVGMVIVGVGVASTEARGVWACGVRRSTSSLRGAGCFSRLSTWVVLLASSCFRAGERERRSVLGVSSRLRYDLLVSSSRWMSEQERRRVMSRLPDCMLASSPPRTGERERRRVV
jgi:hypothetical protein